MSTQNARFLNTDINLTRNSYYVATAPREQSFEALAGEVDGDIAIVGAGIAGLSAAIELADRGYSVVVLEARQVGWGASGRNGGQALAGLACDQGVIEHQVGMADARRVWDMSIEAIELIHERRNRFNIDCDWRPGYLSLAVGERKGRHLREWHDDMAQRYGYQTQWIAPADMPKWIASPRFHSGLHDPISGHLHPLKYVLGLARAAASLGVRIHENSAVVKLEAGTAGANTRSGASMNTICTAGGRVRARHVLLAGNVYLQGVARELEARIMPVGTYIVCSEPLAPELAQSLIPSQSAVCDTNFILDYFRTTADHRMLYGGRVSYSTMTPMNIKGSMQRRMAGTFPQLRDTQVEFAWGGFVDISMNRAPDFGRLPLHGHGGAAPSSSIYYLQGFSGHGLALTGLAGKLVAEAIHGDASRFDVFARVKHLPFPGGKWLRTPALVLGMAWYQLKDLM
jgi:gamma-glutamylputrescine oxidase